MVSVILPTRNRAALLPGAMASVLNQTGVELELIVVDDASGDGTREAVAAVGDDRVRYVRLPERLGACAARNRGMGLAAGSHIAFQDSDDRWRPDKLRRQLAFLEEEKADMVFCGFVRHEGEEASGQPFPPAGTPSGPVGYEQLLFENLASTQCILMTRRAAERVRFDTRLPRMQDWGLTLDALRQGLRVCCQPEALVDVFLQPDSLSRDPRKAVAALRLLLREHRRGIVPSERLVFQWLYSLKHFAAPARERIWRECLLLLSTRHSLELNKRLLLEAKASLLGKPLEDLK